MNVDQPSVVKECVVTSVTCALVIGGVSSVVCAIVVYLQELIAFSGYLAAAFGPVALWLSQDIPSAVKWILAGVFLWSFCISHNLNKKGVTGCYATVVNRTRNVIMCGFGLYWLVQLVIEAEKAWRFGLVMGLVLTVILLFLCLKMEAKLEEDRVKNQALEQSEEDAVQAQGAGQ
jgi:hypothetical protein